MQSNHLRRLLVVAAAGLACATSFPVSARPTGGSHQRAYLACYREVLAQPQFASLDPAGRYQAAASIAGEVMAKCSRHIRPLREELLAGSRKTQKRVLAEGGTMLPPGMSEGIVDALLQMQVADDLAEADPRVKPIADSDTNNAWRRGAARK